MKLLLLGDVCPTDVTAPLWREKQIEPLFGDTLSLFEGMDFRFVNLECALTESEEKILKFGPNLKAPAETAEVLKTIGVDCCGLSNNHVFDFGTQGIADTLRALQANGLDYTGFGKNYEDSRRNYVFEKNGESICIIAVCEHEYSYALENRMGSRPFDEYDTVEDIRAAKEQYGRVIVIYHGGKEFCQYPSPRLRRACRAFVRNGADVVLCQHSHCIGTYETYQGKHILYGQGNFHFVKPHKLECWTTSLAVRYDTGSGEMEFLPLQMTECGIRLAGEAEKKEILDAFSQRNQTLLTDGWKEGWHRFCLEYQNQYRKVICNAGTPESTEQQNGMFAHYLDCEAHTDVWRELFPTYNLTNCVEETEQ